MAVIDFLAEQLHIENGSERVNLYNSGKQRRQHIVEITKIYGYTEFTAPRFVFSLTRWLYSLCWTGTSRLGILFGRCTCWLLSHKVLLSGYSLLERYIARLRNRVENRLWHSLAACIDDSQTQQLLDLLSVPAGSRYSLLDQLRTGPTKVNATSLVQAIGRLQAIRNLGVTLPAITPVSDTRIFNELDSKFKTVRRFLPDLLSRIHVEGNASAKTLIEALCWIEVNLNR
ncbi:DUF4158 domain-containing protein [Salmonella enterica subsp. enterica serovar Pomona]